MDVDSKKPALVKSVQNKPVTFAQSDELAAFMYAPLPIEVKQSVHNIGQLLLFYVDLNNSSVSNMSRLEVVPPWSEDVCLWREVGVSFTSCTISHNVI
jgi:hypothetical protein